LDHAEEDVSAMVTKVACNQNAVTSWQATWIIVSNHIDLTPPELSDVANDTNPLLSGKVSFDSITGFYNVEGIVSGLAVTLAPERNATRTAANLRKSSGYYGIQWAFNLVMDLTKPEPVRSIKLWVHTANKTQIGNVKNPWVSLATHVSKKCYQFHHEVPCLPGTIRNAPLPVMWPLHSTGAHIAKMQPKQGFDALAKALLANLTVTYTPARLHFQGASELTQHVYPANVNLTVPLSKNRVGLAKLGLNVTVQHNGHDLGSVNAVLTKWPCNSVHKGTFNLAQMRSSVMHLKQNNLLGPVTVLDSKKLHGDADITFACTPHGDIEVLNFVGQVPDWSTRLFDDAPLVNLVRPRFHLAQGHSKLVANHGVTNRTIAFYMHTRKTPIRYLAEPQPVWQLEGLSSSTEVNQTLTDFLGPAAKKFHEFFDNSTSRLIGHTWARPGASNISIGFSRDGNETLHDLIFFANTRHDPLIGKPVWKSQQLAKTHNARPWILERSGRRWADPVKYPGVIPVPSGLPMTYSTASGTNLTGQMVGLPSVVVAQPTITKATPTLRKRQVTYSYVYSTLKTGTGTWTVPSRVSQIDVVIVAGGGGYVHFTCRLTMKAVATAMTLAEAVEVLLVWLLKSWAFPSHPTIRMHGLWVQVELAVPKWKATWEDRLETLPYLDHSKLTVDLVVLVHELRRRLEKVGPRVTLPAPRRPVKVVATSIQPLLVLEEEVVELLVTEAAGLRRVVELVELVGCQSSLELRTASEAMVRRVEHKSMVQTEQPTRATEEMLDLRPHLRREVAETVDRV